MGTRHLVCVVQDGQMRVAQYGQWDGYPSGQGMTVLNFLQAYSPEQFRHNVSQVYEMSDERVKALWAECGADDSGWVNMAVSDKFNARYPHLSRDCGAQILSYIEAATEPVGVNLSVEFAADSLMCEWAYVIDLDKNTLEVYKGFNQVPLETGERFDFLSANAYLERRGEDQYYPVKMVQKFSLFDLPDEREFVELCEPHEEQ